MKVSLQLYTLRGELEKDFIATVKRVGELGYDGVEFAGFGGLSSDEMNLVLAESNLYSVGSHTGFGEFESSLEADLEYNKAIGSEYVVCPHFIFDSREDLDYLVKTLNDASVKAEKYGLKIGYHNHIHEFEKIEGEYILDLIAKNTNDNVVLELDVFFVENFGIDPVAYIEKWGKKIELIHLKQTTEDKKNVDLQDGVIDMAKIIDVAKYARHFIVEQNGADLSIFESVKRNVEFLKGL